MRTNYGRPIKVRFISYVVYCKQPVKLIQELSKSYKNVSSYIVVDCGASCTDLFQVALHEIGHNLGLEHSNVKRSIMYPYLLDGNDALETDDIAGIQALYGRPQTYPDQTTTPTYPNGMLICIPA